MTTTTKTQRYGSCDLGGWRFLSRLEKIEKKSQEVQDSGETKIKIWLKKFEKVKKWLFVDLFLKEKQEENKKKSNI